MLTRLGPFSDDDQRWDRFELGAAPHASVRRYRDGFGNATHLISIPRPHEFLEVAARSIVWTLLADPLAPLRRPAAPLSPAGAHDSLKPSRLVPATQEIERMAAGFRPSSPADAFESARALMQLVHSDFEYEPEVTTVATTVAEVVEHRRGVCQDFAHVLIGLCRAVGIPARYVSGYLIVDRSHDLSASERGASVASHAWVEAFSVTHGWRGFDPTNNLLAGEDHVKMAIGRDYGDVPPTRGTSRGVARERLSVTVTVERLE
jgi:transglutaminase-like putative cysteine protease